MSLIDNLNQLTGNTAAEQRIAEYIQQNLATIPTTTTEQMAAETYTSHSAIVRFAQKLGYGGFGELKAAAAELAEQQTPDFGTTDAGLPFHATDPLADIADSIAHYTARSVADARARLDLHGIQQAAQVLLNKQRIFIFAQGDAQLQARNFQRELVKLNRFAIPALDYADASRVATNLGRHDVALFFMDTAQAGEFTRVLRYLHDRQVATVLLANHPAKAIMSLADVTINTDRSAAVQPQGGTFATQAVVAYTLDTLFAAMYAYEFTENIFADAPTNDAPAAPVPPTNDLFGDGE
ncbi:MurR/RpiR family transcriptional regulator [Lacticaseibacillus thailandensis]|uniref:Transcriptional regulator n=1 Tax=Lacticaseibacillus thailandensis DSM 22698 = JCM 13996 TaxID=1423810 RepID=A0A0R2C6Y5_9LACO|nr:MurR/RpiR family transcriptional regulator [Lacticaseibacillus thailandensis]KRM87130.1 transcriptional regulator [Lacticaseibacillus thailandensis DSM 22698 = JCM 13996]